MPMEPYAPRSFRFIELLTLGPSRTGRPSGSAESSRSADAWQMKLYGIAAQQELPRPELIQAAKNVAAKVLENETANNYKVGFIGVHDGRGACFVFVDFWGNENELFHRVFLSRLSDPAGLKPADAADSSVCVWDLRLQAFEREAWIKHVLARASAPDFEAYLADRLNENA